MSEITRIIPEASRLKDASWMRLPPAERDRAIRRLFLSVFNTAEGKEVLTLLLMDLYAFREAHDTEAQILKSFSTRFLKERLGVSDPQALTCAILTTARGD